MALICRKVPESLTQQLDFEKTIRQLQQFKMGKKSRHSQTGLSQDYYCTVTWIFTFTECDTWRSWTLPDGVHEPNFGRDRHQNCSFVSKIGQNGPKLCKNRHRQVFMAARDPWWNTWSVQFKVICDPWLNTWSKWYSMQKSPFSLSPPFLLMLALLNSASPVSYYVCVS